MIFAVLLAPLAIYCLALAFVNTSNRPIYVRGPWDFAGVLFATSGFLVIGGPAILSSLYESWRLSWLLGRASIALGSDDEARWSFWIGLWVVYLLLLLGGAVLLLFSQRRRATVYCLEERLLTEILEQAVQDLGGVVAQRTARSLVIQLPPEAGSIAEGIRIEWESQARLHCVSMRWESPGPAWRMLESTFLHRLMRVESRRTHVSGWFLVLGLGLGCLVTASVLGGYVARILLSR